MEGHQGTKGRFSRELKLELKGLFEQYLGYLTGSSSTEQCPDKGKGT